MLLTIEVAHWMVLISSFLMFPGLNMLFWFVTKFATFFFDWIVNATYE